ncbi:hypothetical protein WBK31_25205 [Nonomuraea sp. N2-4H]|uniref:hypothetical protein n=1 Tax=Nonomuraea sp. N2-4H TaxID=3128898 RepID=UPI00324A473E
MARVRRRDLGELPASLVAEVERRFGAVRGFESRQGGFSYGVLGVATHDDGHRTFIKAVPTEPAERRRLGSGPAGRAVDSTLESLLSGQAAGYRWEAVVNAALPDRVPSPRLLLSCERDDWVLLCFEEAPGRVPHEP